MPKSFLKSIVSRVSAFLVRLGEEQRLKDLQCKFAGFGPGSSLSHPVRIEQPEHVRVGRDVSINAFVHIWGGGGVTIGDRTMIASHAALISLTHDPDSPTMHASLIAAPVKIANDVWIGAHACILPGVSIGEHAVVAAGAVVRDDVPPHAVVGGVPARILRMKSAATHTPSATDVEVPDHGRAKPTP